MATPERVIYHIDCNAFFASVEELLYPELKGSPMAVCGNPIRMLTVTALKLVPEHLAVEQESMI